jgi:MFS family permease
MGLFLGAPVGAVLAGSMGAQRVFFLSSIVNLCAFMMAFFTEDLKKVDTRAKKELRTLTLNETLFRLGNWRLIALSYINLSRTLVQYGVMLTVFQLYLNIQLNMGVELVGLVMAGRTGGMILATFSSGYLTDKIGSKPLIITGLIMSGVCLYVYTVMTTFTEAIVLATIEGAGAGFSFVSLLVFMSDVSPQSIRSGAIGLYRTFQDIGGIVGPNIFMILYISIGSHTAFWIACFLFFFNVAIIFFVKKHMAD